MRRLPWGLVDVTGSSMLPTLGPGDTVLVRWNVRPRCIGIVVAVWPRHPGVLVVKRGERTADGWWLTGDNPAESDDSRVHGVLPDDAVLGRVLLRVRRGPQPRGTGGSSRSD